MTRKLTIIFVVCIFALLGSATLFFYYTNYYNKFAPHSSIAGYGIGGLTTGEAKALLKRQIAPPTTLILASVTKQNFEIPLESVNFSYNLDATLNEAEKQALNKKPIDIIREYSKKTDIPLVYDIDKAKLQEHVNTVISQIAITPIYPSARLEGKAVIIEKGNPGAEVDEGQILEDIDAKLSQLAGSTIVVQTKDIDPTLTDEQSEAFRVLAANYIGKSLKIDYEFQSFNLSDDEIIQSLKTDNSWHSEKIEVHVKNIAGEVNREPQNSVFIFTDNKVTEFVPSKDGLAVKEDELTSLILNSLNNLSQSTEKQIAITIPVESTAPKINNSEVNNLGIRELIGRGTSTFRGSIPSRVHNVALAASKINGALIKPGETFSFNEALGDVSKLTGYKEAYVIKDGRTVLGDGGGVCQVSTTFFRAAMNSGLPIAERRGHSYRVGYYEQDAGPGLDATVYAPTTDLKIVNDTPGHILVQTKTDTKNMSLVFEFYGTGDGRVSSVTKPVITSQTAPPEDLYIDDPTLPTGQVKQVEHKAWGARTVFNYEVKRGDEVIYEKSFVSNYRPWGAVFMRGTKI